MSRTISKKKLDVAAIMGQLNLTPTKFAHKVGVATQTVIRWQKEGEVPISRFEAITALRDSLPVPAGDGSNKVIRMRLDLNLTANEETLGIFRALLEAIQTK